MKVNPKSIVDRKDINLRHGIKSSLPEVNKLFAAVFSLYCLNKKSEIKYSQEQKGSKILICLEKSLEFSIIDFFKTQIKLSQTEDSLFISKFNDNPIFKAQIEHLQVAMNLFLRMGKIEFVDNSYSLAKERKGGDRFNKVIRFSTNIDIFFHLLSDDNSMIKDDAKLILFKYLTSDSKTDINQDLENKLKSIMTIFSEECQFRIRTSSSSEITFQQEGIYEEIIRKNTVDLKDFKGATGPLRILNSFIKNDLHYYFNENNNEITLKSDISLNDLKEYKARVSNYLDLIPKRTVVTETTEINVDNTVEEEKNNNWKPLSKNIIYFGAPGTGKSYTIDKILKPLEDKHNEKIIFHPEYDHASFVGCYKPINQTLEDGTEDIKYRFVPQVFTNIYVKAWNDSCNSYYLVIDEINRGNCAEIFGDLFQLLDREDSGVSKYEITPSEDLKEYLKKTLNEDNMGIRNGKMRLPSNLFILATMNTSDQSLYPMDSAFKRRWDWEYIPIEYSPICYTGNNNDSYSFEVELEGDNTFRWIEFIKKVNVIIKINPNLGADKQIGNYFIKPKENINLSENNKKFKNISLKDFIHKVMFYLWNDVFKDEEESIFDKGETYQDLFPIESNGLNMIKSILDKLEIKYKNNLASEQEYVSTEE